MSDVAATATATTENTVAMLAEAHAALIEAHKVMLDCQTIILRYLASHSTVDGPCKCRICNDARAIL